jgi:glycosyltransferase involved in cell wall biosynthesis
MRIFFIHSGNETFVRIDRALLGESFNVQEYHAARKFPAGLWKFVRGVSECDVLFCWFASWNSFWALLLAKLAQKPSILVIGGYDTASLPEAGYGSQRGGLEKWVSRWAICMATVLLPFSDHSLDEAQRNAGTDPARMQRIYLGVPDPFGALPPEPPERMALTVGNVEWANLKRKGLEPFVRAASHLPDVQFALVGAWKDNSINYLRSIASPNVLFAGRVNDDELQAYYRRASVYVQASLHEGFGLSVAEAMLAGCIPVVTRAGSLPELVGECGLFCESTSPEVIAGQIRSALASSPADRARARERILTGFPLEKRKKCLMQAIQDCGRLTRG